MQVNYPDTENRREIYERLEKEQPDPVHTTRENSSIREHPILFGNEEIDIEKLAGYFGTLEKRLNYAEYFLEDIRKKCDSRDLDPGSYEEIRELKQKEDEINPEFMMKVEYVIFSIKTSLENLAHLLNIAYGLNVKPKYVNIMQILENEDDWYAETLEGAKDEWLTEFNRVRRRMEHHQLFEPVTTVIRNPGKATYHKRAIKVDFPGTREETYPLPQYLDKVIKNAKNLVDEGFGRLSELYDTPSQTDGQPMWDLGIGHTEGEK